MLVLILGIFFFLIKANSPLNSGACERLERGCRAAQAVFFAVIAYAALHLCVPFKRNLTAIYREYGLYIGGSLLVLAAWLYRNSQVSTVTEDIQPASVDAAIAIWLADHWNSGGTLAQDCRQFLGSGTNLPAPAINVIGMSKFQVTACT